MNNVSRLGITAGAALLSVAPLQAQRPNIVFIYADDMGYNDLACYGSKVNDTPNLDKLASEGMRFTDWYSASPVSAPSRAGLLTGRYPCRMGIDHVFFAHSVTGMDQSEVTIPEVLRPRGYASGIFGKWHLGSRVQWFPLQQGFDTWYGSICSIDNPPFVFVKDNTPETHLAPKDSTTQIYMQHAIQFIKDNKDKPFFCYVPFNMPHVPLAATKSFKGKSRNGLYGDVIMELDWAVGQIVKTVDDLGLGENTIICFSSDNGPWLSEGPYGGNADPLFMGKGSTWDGGERVPMIVRWKGHVQAGVENHNVGVMVDWFPTFAELAGGKVPTDRVIDGVSKVPELLGKGKVDQDMFYITSSPMKKSTLSAVRSGDWKLKLPEKAFAGNFWQAPVAAHDTVLFNLKEDIAEQHNVIKQHPDIARLLINKLKAFEASDPLAEPLFQVEMQTDYLTNKQRQDNILKAVKSGVKPKSAHGKLQQEFYQNQEKLQKKGAMVMGTLF